MKNVFGTETTVLNNDLTLVEALELLSGDAVEVLNKVLLDIDAEELAKTSNLDVRGSRIDSEEFQADAIEELKESGLVLVHEDSTEDVSFMSTNKDVWYAAINAKVYETFDLCP